jgi:hypothetical protein
LYKKEVPLKKEGKDYKKEANKKEKYEIIRY